MRRWPRDRCQEKGRRPEGEADGPRQGKVICSASGALETRHEPQVEFERMTTEFA